MCIVVKGPHSTVWRWNSGPSHSLSLSRDTEAIDVSQNEGASSGFERVEFEFKATSQRGRVFVQECERQAIDPGELLISIRSAS